MKKIFALLLGLLLMPVVSWGEGFYNPNSQSVESARLFKQYEQNKFAFAKEWDGKRVIVGGFVDKVDEGRIDGSFGKSPKYPYVMLKSLFRAYLVDQTDLDLANIAPGDGFAFDCQSIKAEDDGMYIQGICKPAFQNRYTEDKKINTIYLTKDPEVQQFVFSEETRQRLWPDNK